MTSDEFTVWFDDYQVSFPGIAEWLRQNSPEPARTLAKWQKVLSPYDSLVCHTVTDRMVDGKLAPVKAYQRELTAQVVANYAQRIVEDLARKEDQARQQAEHLKKRGELGELVPMWRYKEQAMELHQQFPCLWKPQPHRTRRCTCENCEKRMGIIKTWKGIA